MLREPFYVPLRHRAVDDRGDRRFTCVGTARMQRRDCVLVKEVLALPRKLHRLAAHTMLHVDRPKLFRDKRLDALVVLDHKPKRRKLAGTIADYHPIQLRQAAAERGGLQPRKGGAGAQVDLLPRLDGVRCIVVEIHGRGARAVDLIRN